MHEGGRARSDVHVGEGMHRAKGREEYREESTSGATLDVDLER